MATHTQSAIKAYKLKKKQYTVHHKMGHDNLKKLNNFGLGSLKMMA